jgi:hypothetical protein
VFPGELRPLHAALVRYFDFPAGTVAPVCVRAQRGGRQSPCSNALMVTWPAVTHFDGGKPSKGQR